MKFVKIAMVAVPGEVPLRCQVRHIGHRWDINGWEPSEKERVMRPSHIQPILPGRCLRCGMTAWVTTYGKKV